MQQYYLPVDDGTLLCDFLKNHIPEVPEAQKLVMDEQASDPPSSSASDAEQSPLAEDDNVSSQAGTSRADINLQLSADVAATPGNAENSGDAAMTSASGSAAVAPGPRPEAVDERPAKQAKVDSPKRQKLDAPPVHAGNVNAVVQEMQQVLVNGEILHHNDEVNVLEFSQDEIDSFAVYDEDWQFDMNNHDKQHGDNPQHEGFTTLTIPEALWYEGGMEEPQLDAEQLLAIDDIAIQAELSRLISLGVIEQYDVDKGVPENHRELSTRFVISWRPKRRYNKPYWLRRARFVGREFQWMQCERDGGLFSPASSSNVSKLLPSIMQHHDDWCMLTLDFQDAFLTVKQTKPTVVFAYVDNRQSWFHSPQMLTWTERRGGELVFRR